jgi:hypothetical protein
MEADPEVVSKLSQTSVLAIIQQVTLIPTPVTLSISGNNFLNQPDAFTQRRLDWLQILVMQLDTKMGNATPVLHALSTFLSGHEPSPQVKLLQLSVSIKLRSA